MVHPDGYQYFQQRRPRRLCDVTSSHLCLTVFSRYTLAANRTERYWLEVTTSWRRAERKFGWAERVVRFCSACLRAELGRRSADRVCLLTVAVERVDHLACVPHDRRMHPCLLTTTRRRSRLRSTRRPMRDIRSGRTTPRAILMTGTIFTTV